MRKRILIALSISLTFTFFGSVFIGGSYVENRGTVYIFLIPLMLIILVGGYLSREKMKIGMLKYRKAFKSKALSTPNTINSSTNQNHKELALDLIEQIGENTYSRMMEYTQILIKQGDDINYIKSELIKYGLSENNAQKLLEIIYLDRN
jgi:hypothetical protein